MRPIPMTAQSPIPDGATQDADAGLIRDCRTGDVSAFGRLVTRHQDRVYNLCLRMCGRHQDAEDYTQEAFVRAFGALGQFDGRSRFYTWLFRIAVNLILSDRRKGARHRVVSLNATEPSENVDGRPGSLAHDLRANEPDPSDMADLQDRHGRVMSALESLDTEQRAIIILRDIEGLDYAEIAQVLNVAPGTVKSRLHRARLALRERLGDMVDTVDE